MKIKNKEILDIVSNFNTAFTDFNEYISAKVNFKIQKNMKLLEELASEIESSRMAIGKRYGEVNENGYEIPTDKIDIVNEELKELLDIQQEISLMYIKIDELDSIKLTMSQMSALIFMIEE